MSKRRKRTLVKSFKPEIVLDATKDSDVLEKTIIKNINGKHVYIEVEKVKQITLKEKIGEKNCTVAIPHKRYVRIVTNTPSMPHPNKLYKIKPKRNGAVSGTEDLIPDISGGKKNG